MNKKKTKIKQKKNLAVQPRKVIMDMKVVDRLETKVTMGASISIQDISMRKNKSKGANVNKGSITAEQNGNARLSQTAAIHFIVLSGLPHA